MNFDWSYAGQIFPTILRAALVTLEISVESMTVALVAGALFLCMQRTPVKAVSLFGRALIRILRGSPVLVLLFVFFYTLSQYGLRASPQAVGVFTLGIYYGAYVSEVYRAGVEAVPLALVEAAETVGLSRARIWRYILIPLTVRTVTPALGSYFIGIFKAVPYLAIISVQDMLGVAMTEASYSYRYVEPMTIVAVLYLAMSLPAAALVRRLEKRFEFRY